MILNKKLRHFLNQLFVQTNIFFCSCTYTENNDKNNSIFIRPSLKSSGILQNIKQNCNYIQILNDTTMNIYNTQKSDIIVFQDILNYSGLPFGFELYSSNVSNPISLVYKGNRIIIYNKHKVNNDHKKKIDWKTISIIAHQLGHHLSGHQLQNGIAREEEELIADKFSGFILYNMGATYGEATSALNLLFNDTKIGFYPNKVDRLNAIKSGWLEANSIKDSGLIPPPPIDDDLYISGKLKNEFIDTDLINDSDFNLYKDRFEYADVCEGIIMSAETTSGYIDENNYVVRLTKIIPKSFEEEIYDQPGEEIDISLPNENADLDKNEKKIHELVKKALVPGRTIQFKYVDLGGSINDRYFFYLKIIPR